MILLFDWLTIKSDQILQEFLIIHLILQEKSCSDNFETDLFELLNFKIYRDKERFVTILSYFIFVVE